MSLHCPDTTNCSDGPIWTKLRPDLANLIGLFGRTDPIKSSSQAAEWEQDAFNCWLMTSKRRKCYSSDINHRRDLRPTDDCYHWTRPRKIMVVTCGLLMIVVIGPLKFLIIVVIGPLHIFEIFDISDDLQPLYWLRNQVQLKFVGIHQSHENAEQVSAPRT